MKLKYIGPKSGNKEVFHGWGQSFEKGQTYDIKDAALAHEMSQHAYFEEDTGKGRAKADKDKMSESVKADKEAEIQEAEVEVEEAEAKLEQAKK